MSMNDRTDSNSMGLRDPIGLCADCRHARIIQSSRGSTFYLCHLSESDARFPRYPRLPVIQCAGYTSAISTMGAVVLAAGQAHRMGQNKMLLPFGASTVLETIVSEIAACSSITDLVVVTGYERERVEALLASYPVRCVFNPAHAQAEMLVSLQVGLRALHEEVAAALIVPGDHPRLRGEVMQRVIEAHQPNSIVVPSYQMKRGHPIVIDRAWWPEVLSLPETATLRDFIRAHEDRVRYVVVETDSVLRDMDTPEEYNDLLSA